MNINHMPKSKAVVLIRGAFGQVVEAGTYANAYKAASKIANELRSGTYARHPEIQEQYNEAADKISFDWQEPTAADVAEDAEVNELAAADAVAEEAMAAEATLDSLEKTHTYANNYGGPIDPASYKAQSAALRKAGDKEAWNRLAASYYGYGDDVEKFVAAHEKKMAKRSA